MVKMLMVIISLVAPMLIWSTAMAGVPVEKGECKENYVEVYPPKVSTENHNQITVSVPARNLYEENKIMAIYSLLINVREK